MHSHSFPLAVITNLVTPRFPRNTDPLITFQVVLIYLRFLWV